jgi:hypothetical protein
MADKRKIHVDFTGAVFIGGIFVLILFFWGEPDLHDAIIHRLMATPDAQIESAE